VIDDATLTYRARTLAATIEPFAGQVYFSPECHAAYEALGFQPSPGEVSGVAMPDGAAYFCSRGSVMGQVPGEVIAAAFAVFNPAAVVPAVTWGWTLSDAASMCDARTSGAVAQLVRILGPEPDGLARATELLQRATQPLRPEGRPLFSGLRSLGTPGDPMGDVWRLADMLREYRGDAHTAAWTSAGFDAAEIGLLTELYWGLPPRSYVRTRAWSDDDLDAAWARLEQRRLVDGSAMSARGRTEREAVEVTTDRQCRAAIETIGDDFDELVGILAPWGAAIRAAGGYLPTGPHELATAASR
jgi:Helix-turn-helix family